MIVFSIIIPAYNLEQYIVKTLESITENDIVNTEVIVIDDGSTDNTRVLAEQFLDINDVPHYVVLSQENSGVSVARNAGISRARGKYIIFCDGDDFCATNMIERLNMIKNTNHDMLIWRYNILQDREYTVSQKEFQNTVLYNKDVLKSFLLQGNRIRLGSFAVKKSLLEKAGIYFTKDCAIAEDIEFMYKCLAMAESVYTINDILFTYVKRDGSAMNAFNMKRFQAPEAIRRVYQYVKANTNIPEDFEMNDYLQNGLYILHSMFSFDSCIKYLKNGRDAGKFIRTYFEQYSGIENELKYAAKNMKVYPPNVSKRRIKIFCVNRKMYIYFYMLRNIVKKD